MSTGMISAVTNTIQLIYHCILFMWMIAFVCSFEGFLLCPSLFLVCEIFYF